MSDPLSEATSIRAPLKKHSKIVIFLREITQTLKSLRDGNANAGPHTEVWKGQGPRIELSLRDGNANAGPHTEVWKGPGPRIELNIVTFFSFVKFHRH